METALSEIEFLALSANRVEVLDLLATGRRTRTDLAAATGASQATLGRILDDFQERSWIRREGSDYVATATGRLVADGVTDLLAILKTERELRDLVPYVPDDALTFDLRHLSDATVTQPTQTRPNAPVQRVLDLLADAESVLSFSHAFNEQSLSVVADRVTDGSMRFRGVFSRSTIDAIASDSELSHRLASLVDAENAAVRIHDGEIPLAVTVADDVVHLLFRDGRGVLQGSIDTDDAAVHEWSHERFEEYWESATPLDPSVLTE